jgi:ABC-type multidrug transport system fused ATPase/permease subunit
MKKIISFFHNIKEIIRILWEASKIMTLLLLFNNIIRNALWPLRGLVVKQIIDMITLSLEKGIESYQRPLALYILLFFLFFWLNRIWWPLNSFTQALMLSKIGHGTRMRIIKVMENIELSFFDKSENYDTYHKALELTNGRQPINVVNNILGLISLIISFVSAFTVMISINIPVSIILIISSIPSLVWENRFNQKLYNFEQETTREKRLLNYIFKLFTDKKSAKEIRTFRFEKYLSDKHEAILKDYNSKYFRLITSKIKIDSLFWILMQISLMASYFIIIASASEGRIPLGDLSFFLSVSIGLQNAIKNIESSFNNVIQSSRYIDNLTSFEKSYLNISTKHGYKPIPETVESIEFRNVSFSYPNSEKAVLKNVSFKLSVPQNVILLGENGSGKTTLIKLLLGFYKPSKGEILLNGCNISDFDIRDYHKLFSVCFQDYIKYGFSLKDNIIMANSNIDDITFEQIIGKVQLLDLVRKLPYQEQTYLSKEYDEKGVELSGGQYNKIAIARALAKNSKIVVFDEPNASLDAKAEQNLFNLYSELTKDKLGIMITHRLSTAVCADMILVLKDGKLVEHGTHDQLMKLNQEYAFLFNMQSKQYISEVS